MLDLRKRGKALAEFGEVSEKYKEWYEEENGSFVDTEFDANNEGCNKAFALIFLTYHRTPLVQWSLYKYKCLWGVEGKGQDSSLQKGVSHTYT